MCVEAAVCFALGEPHGDKPTCVSPVLRQFKIALNDKEWSSNAARAQGLRRIAVAQLGTRDTLDENLFLKMLTEMTIRKMVPLALRAAASVNKSAEHVNALTIAAQVCEQEGTRESVGSANKVARAAANAANAAANAANAAANAAAAAAANAANAAYAANAADAADDAEREVQTKRLYQILKGNI